MLICEWVYEPDYRIYWHKIFPTKEEVLQRIKEGKQEHHNHEELMQFKEYLTHLTETFNNYSLEERLKIIHYYQQQGLEN